MKKTKAGYVDGFVFAVPKKNFAAYKKMATEGMKTWIKHGALSYAECQGDDLKGHPGGKGLLFPNIIKQKKDEVVWFSFITYKNKKHRDAVNAKVMKELGKKYESKKEFKMPFEENRMTFGGFKVIVGA